MSNLKHRGALLFCACSALSAHAAEAPQPTVVPLLTKDLVDSRESIPRWVTSGRVEANAWRCQGRPPQAPRRSKQFGTKGACSQWSTMSSR
jgi:hypothetical protein